jgi:dissimilatory sulfite reductase (desulfoviridin) alpha/beta subunit
MNTIENIQELWMREQQENAIHRETIKNTMSKVRMREFYKELEEERNYDRFICKTVV